MKTGVRKFNKIIVKEMTNDHYQHFADLTENFNEEINEYEAINIKLDDEVARKLFEFLSNLKKLSINSEFFEPEYDTNLLKNALAKCTELKQVTIQGTQYHNTFRQIDFKSSKLKILKIDWKWCKISDLLDQNRNLNLKYSSISELIINSKYQQTDNAALKLILEMPHLISLKIKLFQKTEIDEDIFKKTYPNIKKLDLTDAYIDDDSECNREDLERNRLKKWSIVKIYEFLSRFPNLKILDLNIHISARYDPTECMKTFHPPAHFSFNLNH